jgi:hypothetical protein
VISHISKPLRDHDAKYDLALSIRRSIETKARLTAARTDVLGAYKRYDASSGSAAKLKPLVLDPKTAADLKKNYQLTYSGKSLSQMRDDILATAPFGGLCPMCGRTSASTLDHYLPEDVYPEYALLGINLVPACKDCNHSKSTHTGSTATGRFLHIYYDDLTNLKVPLLTSTITTSPGVVARFSVNSRLSTTMYRNASYHFAKLNLEHEYRIASVSELLERCDLFYEAYQYGKASAVADEARRQAKSLRRRFNVHYWKAALYDGVSASLPFCAGGFNELSAEYAN